MNTSYQFPFTRLWLKEKTLQQEKVSTYHFESKESIEASLVMWLDPSEDVAPSGCLTEAEWQSPMWEGLHDESWTSSAAGDWVCKLKLCQCQKLHVHQQVKEDKKWRFLFLFSINNISESKAMVITPQVPEQVLEEFVPSSSSSQPPWKMGVLSK